MKMGVPEGNSYSKHPQDVRMNTLERDQLAGNIQEAMDEAFLFANHSETMATIKPLELETLGHNELYDTFTNAIPFNQGYVEATFDRSDNGTVLRNATIRLRNSYIKSMRVDLFIKAGDDIDEFKKEYIDPEEPLFYIDAPVDAYSFKRERMYLNYTMTKNLMNHVVTLAHPVAALTNPERNLAESIEALMAVSEATSVSRSTKYAFYPNDNEKLIVNINDRGMVEPRKESESSYREVNIEKIRSFGKAGTLATSLHVAASKYEVNATLSKEFSYNDGSANDIAARSADVSEAFQSVSADAPQEFGRQVLDSIYRLSSVMANAGEIEQLEF
jgi:hypothetical protein